MTRCKRKDGSENLLEIQAVYLHRRVSGHHSSSVQLEFSANGGAILTLRIDLLLWYHNSRAFPPHFSAPRV